MKKISKLKSKIIMFIFALVFPLSATGLVYSFENINDTKAADTSSATNYYSSYMKEVTLTNNNFNSSSSNHSISTSLTGWTGQVTDKKTTAGIINTGNTFQTYMDGTYQLSKNPLAKASSDKKILMINSKTSSGKSYTARQGYKSSSVTLDANSYYSFQVSFKSDTNYDPYTTYVEQDTVANDMTIVKATFNNKGFGEYISFSYNSREYYLHKTLTTDDSTLAEAKEDVTLFYEDEEYVGTMIDDKPVYFSVKDIEKVNMNEEDQINIKAGAKKYTCDIEYNGDTYTVKAGTQYYATKTEYSSLNDYVFGSIYLSGLKDSERNDVKAEYVKVTSKEWVTFYFFVATGNESQSVSLDLWLGTQKANNESSGVVFFDDCHVYKYSENSFWKTYQSYFGKNYTQEIEDENGDKTTQTYECVDLVDLRNNDARLEYPTHNFDFEEGIYNEDVTSLKEWHYEGTGKAQVFDSRAPQYFKQTTGHGFVGSNLSCEAEIEGETVSITPNNYVLALWGRNEHVKVKSKDIEINANEVYKVKAYYKVSNISTGNAYMFVEENDKVLSTYSLTDTDYTLKAETASSSLNSNADNDFVNDYSVVEFYVKGGALYNSSVNISLGLGKSDELATGCVVFDNVTVELATTEEYNSATNKIALDEKTGTTTVTNGTFNNVTIDSTHNHPYAAADWTVNSGSGIVFDGVINTEAAQFAKYVEKYETLRATGVEDEQNPYYWATYTNPGTSKGGNGTDNVFMLANMTNSWQSAKSANFSLTANTTYKLSFKFKTYDIANNTTIKVSLFNKNNIKLFEVEGLETATDWKTYEIYLKSFAGADEAYITIDLGTADKPIDGYVFLDDFDITSVDNAIFTNKLESAEGSQKTFGVVDMSNFYLNIPTSNVTEDISTSSSPAFKGSVNSSDGGVVIGGVLDGNSFDSNSIFKITDDQANKDIVFYFTNQGIGSYTYQSNFTLDMESGKYYALSFKVKSNFNYTNPGVSLDDDKTYEYGLTFGLTGFEYMKGLVSNEDYQTYTIYFNPSEAASANLYMSFVSDAIETTGTVVIYDVKFEESDEDTFNMANTTVTADEYNLNEDRVSIAKAEGSTESDEEAEDGEGENENPTQSNFDWLLIPTLITALAIVIAVVGFVLRKVKIKKIKRKRKESYDRKSSLQIDAVKQQARKLRNAEVAEVQKTIDKFQAELENLESAHKQKVLNLREKDKGQVSKETDREFKSFAQKRTVIAEKIETLNKQIEELKSPEYLLSLERKVYAQEEMKQKELYKVSKKYNKEQEKKEASTKKTDKK